MTPGALLLPLLLGGLPADAQEPQAPPPQVPPASDGDAPAAEGAVAEHRLPPTRVGPPPEELAFRQAFRLDLESREDFLERKQVRFLPDAFREKVGIALQRTGPGQASPYLRGFTGFRTLMLIDGFRFNHAAWRDGPNQYLATVDAEMVEVLETRLGSGGVRHGNDAVGGTINIVTREAGPALAGRQHTGLLATRLASAERSAMGRAEAGGQLGDEVLYRIGVTARTFGDLRGGRSVREQRNTSFDEGAGDAKLTWLVGDRSALTFAYQIDRQVAVPRTHSTVDGINWHGTTNGSDLRRDLDHERDWFSLKLETLTLAPFDRADIGVLAHHQGESRTRVRGDGRRDEQGLDVHTLGTFVNLESASAIGDLRYGFDVYRDSVDSFRDDYAADGSFTGSAVQGPVADDSTYDLAGIFVEDDLELGGGYWIRAGARYSWGRAAAGRVVDPATGTAFSLEDAFGAFSFEAQLVREWAPLFESYAAVSRAVRLPNLSDLTRFDAARSGEIETPSPGLDPETFLTLELGTRLEREQFGVEAALYSVFLHDLIVRFPTGDVVDGDREVKKRNAGDGWAFGFDLFAFYRPHPHWRAAAGVTWINGETDTFLAPGVEAREPLDRLPPFRTELSLRWTPEATSRFWTEAVAILAARQDRLSSRDEADTDRIPPGGTPGYAVFALRAGLDLTENLRISAAVENLVDSDYRLHGSGVNEPGRNLVLSARLVF